MRIIMAKVLTEKHLILSYILSSTSSITNRFANNSITKELSQVWTQLLHNLLSHQSHKRLSALPSERLNYVVFLDWATFQEILCCES